MKQTNNKDKVVVRMLHTCSDVQVREAGEGEEPSRTITGYAILFVFIFVTSLLS